MTKLIHMAHEAGEGETSATISVDYPFGLRLTLNGPELEKLGLDELPEAGTEVTLGARAIVTRAATEDPDADGDIDQVCVELQITHLGLGDEEEKDENPVDARDRKARTIYDKGLKKDGEREVGGSPEKGEFGALNRRYGA